MDTNNKFSLIPQGIKHKIWDYISEKQLKQMKTICKDWNGSICRYENLNDFQYLCERIHNIFEHGTKQIEIYIKEINKLDYNPLGINLLNCFNVQKIDHEGCQLAIKELDQFYKNLKLIEEKDPKLGSYHWTNETQTYLDLDPIFDKLATTAGPILWKVFLDEGFVSKATKGAYQSNLGDNILVQIFDHCLERISFEKACYFLSEQINYYEKNQCTHFFKSKYFDCYDRLNIQCSQHQNKPIRHHKYKQHLKKVIDTINKYPKWSKKFSEWYLTRN